VHRCVRTTINFSDPKKGKQHVLDNVLVRKGYLLANTKLSFQRMIITQQPMQEEENSSCQEINSADHSEDELGYCIKRKLSSSVYGSVYKGFVVKKLKCKTILSPRRKACVLDVIREDDELLDSKQNIVSSDDDFLWEPMNQNVIIKATSWDKLRRLRGKHLEDPLKEIQALQLLEGSTLGTHHPNIIRNLVALQDDKYLYSVTPYCRDGDLCGVIMNDINAQSRLNEDRAKHWFRQILLALHHLQQKGVCHRDLSLENIVVHGKTCKLIDFGMALRIPYVHPSNIGSSTDVSDGTTRLLMTAQGQGGDFTYMSPEVLSRDSAFDGFAIDLWSAGVILYIMLIGSKPFKWPHPTDELFTRISEEGLLKESLEYWEIELSDEAAHLLQNMLWKDKRKRLTLAQVMEHPWLKTDDDKFSASTTSDSSTTSTKSSSKLWLRRSSKRQ
jgi:Serine/threonine protein kinase